MGRPSNTEKNTFNGQTAKLVPEYSLNDITVQELQSGVSERVVYAINPLSADAHLDSFKLILVCGSTGQYPLPPTTTNTVVYAVDTTPNTTLPKRLANVCMLLHTVLLSNDVHRVLLADGSLENKFHALIFASAYIMYAGEMPNFAQARQTITHTSGVAFGDWPLHDHLLDPYGCSAVSRKHSHKTLWMLANSYSNQEQRFIPNTP